jgi:hypothetical protein
MEMGLEDVNVVDTGLVVGVVVVSVKPGQSVKFVRSFVCRVVLDPSFSSSSGNASLSATHPHYPANTTQDHKHKHKQRTNPPKKRHLPTSLPSFLLFNPTRPKKTL